MKKEETFWCLFWPSGPPMIKSVSYTRSQAIDNRNLYCSIPKISWSRLYREGYRCKKVKIVELKDYEIMHGAYKYGY